MKNYLSIIIPTLNEEKYLPKLLNDLLSQKEKDFEVIVVDCCSEDGTKEVAQSYKTKLKLTFLQNKKKNVASQRNLGAQKAKGDYLIFLDADSRINSTFIKKLRIESGKNKGLIYLPFIQSEKNTYQDKIVFNLANFLVNASQKIGKPFSSGGSMIFQKDFFNYIGGFDDRLFISEDHEIIQRSFDHGVLAKTLKTVKIKVCLRRMEKEGRLKLFTKYLIAAVQVFNKDSVDKKIFNYDMGGAGYEILKDKNKSLDKVLQEYFKKITSSVKSFIIES